MPQIIQVSPWPVPKDDKCGDQAQKDMADNGLEDRESAFSKTHSVVWKPLVYSMRLFGFVLLKPKKRCWCLAMRIYSMVVLIATWANIIRLFFMYRIDDDEHGLIMHKINFHIWSFFCAVCVTTIYKTGYRNQSFHEFLVKWSHSLQKDAGCPHSGKHIHQMRRRVLGCVSVSWIAVLIIATLFVYCQITTQELDYTFAPFLPANKCFSSMRVVLLFPQLYMAAAWIFGLCLFFLLSEAISLQFNDFQKSFAKAITSEEESLDMETFRRRHHKICHLLDSADKVLNVFIATALETNIGCGMLLLYQIQIVWSRKTLSSDTLVYVWYSVWLAVTVVIILVVCYGGGHLNHLAHSALKVIQDIRLKEVSTKMSVEINLFLTKLTAECIGLTAMGMFVITKATILAIAGAFVTYYIVLVQLKDPPSSPDTLPPGRNSTGFLSN